MAYKLELADGNSTLVCITETYGEATTRAMIENAKIKKRTGIKAKFKIIKI